MPLSSSNAARQLSDGNSQGTIFGNATTDLIGFYAVATPVAKSSINFATLSQSSGALSSSLAMVLGTLGLITCTSVAG